MHLTIHVTDRMTYRSCRRKFKYSVLSRIAPKDSDTEHSATNFGTAGHNALEVMYRNLNTLPIDTIKDMVSDAFDYSFSPENERLGKALCTNHVVKYYDSDLRDMNIVSIEAPNGFYIEIDSKRTVYFSMKMDLVYYNPSNRIVVQDHKFYSQYPHEVTIALDDQITAYLWAMHELNWNPLKLVLNVIKKQMPTGIDIKGSKLKYNPKTVNLALLREYMLDEMVSQEDYNFAVANTELFKRYDVMRSKYQLERFKEQLYVELDEITDPRTVFYMNPTRDCPYCQYKTLCRTEFSGGNIDQTIELGYREKRNEER